MACKSITKTAKKKNKKKQASVHKKRNVKASLYFNVQKKKTKKQKRKRSFHVRGTQKKRSSTVSKNRPFKGRHLIHSCGAYTQTRSLNKVSSSEKERTHNNTSEIHRKRIKTDKKPQGNAQHEMGRQGRKTRFPRSPAKMRERSRGEWAQRTKTAAVDREEDVGTCIIREKRLNTPEFPPKRGKKKGEETRYIYASALTVRPPPDSPPKTFATSN